METMPNSDKKYSISVRRTIDASAEKAYKALTIPNLVSKWFTKKAMADLRVGGRYSNSNGDEGIFLKLVPGNLVKFTWDNKERCPGTFVTIRIKQKAEGKIIVVITHSGIKTRKECAGMLVSWSWAIDSLKLFLETGKNITYEDWMKTDPEPK